MTTVYVAVAHINEEFAVQACATFSAALTWLATHNIDQPEWDRYVDGIVAREGAIEGLSKDRTLMDPEVVLFHWYGDKADGENLWGDGDISAEILTQEPIG